MIGNHWHDEILFHTLSYECLEDNGIFTDGVYSTINTQQYLYYLLWFATWGWSLFTECISEDFSCTKGKRMCALQRSCPTLHRNNINVDSRRVIFYLHSIYYLPCYHLTLFIDEKEGKKIFRLALYIRCLFKEVVGGLALDGGVNLCACPRMCLKWQSWKRKQKTP